MANVQSMQVEINTATVERIKELEAELNKARAFEVGYLADIARLWLERDKLRAELDEWQRRAESFSAQMARENDLWVVMPEQKEMVQLRWYRQKAQL